MPEDKKLISIVVPVYNEATSINLFYDALTAAIQPEDNYDFEILFMDNCSSDDTFGLIKKLCADDERIRVIRYSRNFGFQNSVFTGLCDAKGAAAIQIDCDLQDPPEIISAFLRKWEEGYEVVFGTRESRDEAFWLVSARRAFYRFVSLVSEHPIPVDAGDFRLVDRKILDILSQSQERNLYIRGMISGYGFRQIGIPYHRVARQAGTSKFTMRQYISLAFDAIVNNSAILLRLSFIFGMGVSFLAFLYSGYLIVSYLFFDTDWPRGFGTLAVLIMFGIGINAVFLGLIGEYLARIYRQLKQEPRAIIDERYPPSDR